MRRNRLLLAVRSIPRLGQVVQVTRRLTLLQSYTVVSALCVLGLVFGLGALITRHLTERMLVRDGQLTAKFVRAQVREHLAPADFAPGAPERFVDAFREISKIPEILQANVFDKTGTVIWSSEPSLVGQRFPGKHDLQEAFEGRLVTGVAKGKPEQIKGPGVPGRLVELYVPFSFGGGPVVGVLETYKAPILLDQSLLTDDLIRRRGVEGLLADFRAFADSNDRLGHFRRVFGLSLKAFEHGALARIREEVQRGNPALVTESIGGPPPWGEARVLDELEENPGDPD